MYVVHRCGGLRRTETPRGSYDPDREMCMIDRLLLRSSDRLAITGRN